MTKVFVIDDEDSVVRLLVEYFSHFDYECHGYSFDQDLLESIRCFMPDIIISDMNLHNTNGINILMEVKRNIDLVHIPFIFLSGSVDDDLIQKGFELGADDCLKKPLDLSEIKNQIEHILQRKNKFASGPIHLLVMEKDESRIELIEQIFTRYNGKIYISSSIKEAVNICQNNQIDMVIATNLLVDGDILTFYNLPVLDFSETYFALLINNREVEYIKKARNMGVNDFIYLNYGNIYLRGKLIGMLNENRRAVATKDKDIKKTKSIINN